MDYLKVIAEISEKNHLLDEDVVLPDQAGKSVVDYEAVAKKWKEGKGWMRRVDQEEKNCGTKH